MAGWGRDVGSDGRIGLESGQGSVLEDIYIFDTGMLSQVPMCIKTYQITLFQCVQFIVCQ